MKKFLIIGLGNPIKKYEYTRHNIGSFIVKLIILKEKFKKKYNNKLGDIYIKKYNNLKLFCLLSNLYINNIGISINFFLKKYKLKYKNLIVISDDIYINFGKIKIKTKGGSGGHNGLKNIQKILKTNKYLRIKVGIGHDFNYGEQNKYVLSPITKKELNYIKKYLYLTIYNILINL
ncbi:MAG: aminoacyl-tRNA hydrolase [Candidatus Shikimatogenerans sp. JK-2022]|nr:aminoacyl-tRNA hydrolase [Candidatus Shikimatogenerans bostrichidophilus]